MKNLSVTAISLCLALQPVLASAATLTVTETDSMPLPPDTQWIGARIEIAPAVSDIRPPTLTWMPAPSRRMAKNTTKPSPRTLRRLHAEQEQNRLKQLGMMQSSSSMWSASSSSASSAAAAVNPYKLVGDFTPALAATGYSVGEATAPVTIVEFIDYGCPACATFGGDTMAAIYTSYIQTGKVRFVFRNFPLSYHPASNAAALALECSRDQSESYAMSLHSSFMAATAANGKLVQKDIDEAVAELKDLDRTKLKTCVDTEAKQALINQDIEDAINGGINGTPSFWVLGKADKAVLIQGAVDFAAMKKVLDPLLK